jgi:hypothetical protein
MSFISGYTETYRQKQVVVNIQTNRGRTAFFASQIVKVDADIYNLTLRVVLDCEGDNIVTSSTYENAGKLIVDYDKILDCMRDS